jgi:predicted nucleic acid-binding protein
MSTIVVDTDVVSFAFKNHPIALEYLPDPIDRSPIISFMTVAELDRWALQAGWGAARRTRLQEDLERFVIFPYDRELCTKWAEVTVAAQSGGRRIECADAWVAATAAVACAATHSQSQGLSRRARSRARLPRGLSFGM